MAARAEMEAHDEKHTPFGPRQRHWGEFKRGIAVFGVGLRALGLFERGVQNARAVRLRRLDIDLAALPAAFDGYRILHITDPHLDGLPQFDDVIVDLVRGLAVDLVALTGDYRWRVHGEFRQILPAMAKLVDAVAARDGILATLGNHDTVAMVEPFEQLGLRVLANETVTVRRGDAAIHVTGLDDVHYFYTDAAAAALSGAPPGCKIALVHSPEVAHLAAPAGYALYLCGHTHAGQICLPGGQPIITNSALHWRHARGLWRRGDMLGYTSPGAGTSGLPVRYFTRGEVTVLTLRRGKT
ncbi:MAG TPA: metallophosphoesterase [Methylomirabilota bacterium]|nr:metallophosphoesterase [Methylomirabilota bacterium]